jgi:hypothetical protein
MRLTASAVALAALVTTTATAQLPDVGGDAHPVLNGAVNAQGVNLPNGASVRRSPTITIGAEAGLSYNQVFTQGRWRHSLAGGVN